MHTVDTIRATDGDVNPIREFKRFLVPLGQRD